MKVVTVVMGGGGAGGGGAWRGGLLRLYFERSKGRVYQN